MKYCDLSEDRYGMWCDDHTSRAKHVATDGDTPVCETYAKAYGCNCGHYDSTENDSAPMKTLRALSRALGDYGRYDCPEIEQRARGAVQKAVDQAIRELEEN
jgi:hypothetical protein